MSSQGRSNAATPGSSSTRPRQVKRRYSRQLIDETIEVWQPYYEKKLTDADACEIIENMSLFVGGLLGLRRDLQSRGKASLTSD
ncbi:MAG: hypothetical protein JF608_04865 [Sphingomonadales bacterium]|nr:hypothetical protein [Sphingomonadales bacterium]